MAQLDEKRSALQLQENSMIKDNKILIESEQEVLGSLLKNNSFYDEINLHEYEFFVKSHQDIFSGIQTFLAKGKNVDLILLAEHFDKQGILESVGDLKYIGHLVQSALCMNIKSHAKNISDAYKLRKLKELINTLSDAAEQGNDIDDVCEIAENGFAQFVSTDGNSGMAHIKNAVIEAIEWEDKEVNGLKTGLRDLDRLINGLNKSDLIILAARPSMGKSSLAGQIAEHIALKESVVFFSLEMAKRQVAARMIKFHEERVGKSQAIAHLCQLKMHIDDTPAITVGHIRSKCRQIKRQHGLSLIVVDYIQLMRGDGDNRNQEIGSISRGLKGIAKEFDVPVIALSQLNREVDKRADKRPLMSDLRESGEIEQDADLILFIYRDQVYNSESEFGDIAEIICRKNRNGAIGDIQTEFQGFTTRFNDYNGEKIVKFQKKVERSFVI